MYKINLFNNLKSPKNPQIISIENYIQFVKEGIDVQKLLAIRLFGKHAQEYIKYKEKRLCVTHNFLFNGIKRNSNIISSTGLLYFDIDTESFEINSIDKSKVFIFHKSFGGIGSSIIIRAKGITYFNFKESCKFIAKDLGIANYIDINAIKETQFTVLSYDPNLFYNNEAYEYSAEKVSFSNDMFSSFNSFRNDTNFDENKLISNYRISNASDYVQEENQYEVFPEGIQTALMNIPSKVSIGSRSKVLMAIVNQMVALNKFLSYEKVLDKSLAINNIFTSEPLTYKEVLSIVGSIYRYKNEGTLTLILNKKRKIIFNKNCGYTREDKIAIVNKEVGAMRTAKTKGRIKNAIDEWQMSEKITAKKIARNLNLGIGTVKRYWPEFKNVAQDYNRKLKQSEQK